MDSNHRPHDYQSCALASWAIGPCHFHISWWRVPGSNRWPPACKAGALPAELTPHIVGIKATTYAFNTSIKCSTVSLFLLSKSNSLRWTLFWFLGTDYLGTSLLYPLNWITHRQAYLVLTLGHYSKTLSLTEVSLERRWSSRTFRYGYLVTTSPQLPDPPSAAPSLRLDYGLRVFPTLMVWRAVCTRPGNVFTAACWSAITSNSSFMQASCSLQSELRPFLGICSTSRLCFPLLTAIVLRV